MAQKLVVKGIPVKKQIIAMVFCIAVLMGVAPVIVHADTGPKPSVVVDFRGLEGEQYFVTLLAEESSTGPHSTIDFAGPRYQPEQKDYEIFRRFAEYQDADGFYFLQFFQECTVSHQFSWGYYPPQKFKILVYFPATDSFLADDECLERYAFDSYYTIHVSGTGMAAEREMRSEKSYDYLWEIAGLIARIVITLAVEIGILLLFRFREKRQIWFIVGINIATQIALNLGLHYIAVDARGAFLLVIYFYFLLEFLVFAIEAIAFTLYFQTCSKQPFPKWKPCLYALAANAASFVVGVIISFFIPGIF